jgi:signal transduction histidine kinase
MRSITSLLIVDDSTAEREITTLHLAAAFPDAEIIAVGVPAQAQAMCGDHEFDCVVLDYNMPGLDGLELTRLLRVNNPYVPIILITSVGDEMLAAEALRSGVSDYLPKARITAQAMRRSVARSSLVCDQARMIDEQRAELENFAYALAHDFKQPIRQISTFAQLIAEEIHDDQSASTEQHLKFLGAAALRLGKLVDVMSQYTLLNQPPELADIDLEQVLDDVRAALAIYLVERGGELVSTGPLPVIHGNGTLMTQVLQNLVFNALQYNTHPAPRVELTVSRENDHWIMALKDNGVGIEPQYLAEIFKPLVRLHNASEYPGSGLGLTLARKAVLSQKGAIWCTSVWGEGSTFHLRLPAALQTAKALGSGNVRVLHQGRVSDVNNQDQRRPAPSA